MADLTKQGPQNLRGNQPTYTEVSLEKRWQLSKACALVTLQELLPFFLLVYLILWREWCLFRQVGQQHTL